MIRKTWPSFFSTIVETATDLRQTLTRYPAAACVTAGVREACRGESLRRGECDQDVDAARLAVPGPEAAGPGGPERGLPGPRRGAEPRRRPEGLAGGPGEEPRGPDPARVRGRGHRRARTPGRRPGLRPGRRRVRP